MTPAVSVLDAYAMLAYLNNEAGADVVEDVLTDPGRQCYAHAVNVCEVYYQVLRKQGQAIADASVQKSLSFDIDIREEMKEAFWRRVGQNKVPFTRALGDCFCLALAQHIGGEVITRDHQFDPVDAQGACPVRFIR